MSKSHTTQFETNKRKRCSKVSRHLK